MLFWKNKQTNKKTLGNLPSSTKQNAALPRQPTGTKKIASALTYLRVYYFFLWVENKWDTE